MTLSRRLFLLAGAALPVWPMRGQAASAGSAAVRLARLAGPPSSARALGLAYLAGRSEQASAPLLAAQLAETLGLSEIELAACDDDRLRALLAERIRADFAAGRTERARGWILAATEARLFALAAVQPPSLH